MLTAEQLYIRKLFVHSEAIADRQLYPLNSGGGFARPSPASPANPGHHSFRRKRQRQIHSIGSDRSLFRAESGGRLQEFAFFDFLL